VAQLCNEPLRDQVSAWTAQVWKHQFPRTFPFGCFGVPPQLSQQQGSAVSNPQKRKGDAAERELAHLLEAALGTGVRRKLGAGRTDDTGDLDGLPDCTAQVKNYTDILRAIREGLAGLETQQANAGTIHGVLFIRRKGGQWIAIQTLNQWTTMFRETLTGPIGHTPNSVLPSSSPATGDNHSAS